MSAAMGGRGSPFRFLLNIHGLLSKNAICLANGVRVFRVARARPFSLTAISLEANQDVAVHENNNQSSVEKTDSQISEMCDPFVPEKEECLLCKVKHIPVSFKNVQLLSQFVSPNTGLVIDRKITKLCEMQQKRVEKEVATSRKFGFMPYMYRETVFLKDPGLYDVRYTGNPDIGTIVTLPKSTEDFEKTAKPVTETILAPKKTKQRKRAKPIPKDEKKKKK